MKARKGPGAPSGLYKIVNKQLPPELRAKLAESDLLCLYDILPRNLWALLSSPGPRALRSA